MKSSREVTKVTVTEYREPNVRVHGGCFLVEGEELVSAVGCVTAGEVVELADT